MQRISKIGVKFRTNNEENIFCNTLQSIQQQQQSHNTYHCKTIHTEYQNQGQFLQEQFMGLLTQINSNQYFQQYITKHQRIRVDSWLKLLNNIQDNTYWKKNRNNYAKLLLLMLNCHSLIQPFLSIQNEDQVNLPKLNKHEIDLILDAIQKNMKKKHKGVLQNNFKKNKENYKKNLFILKTQPSIITEKQSIEINKKLQNNQYYSKNRNNKSTYFANKIRINDGLVSQKINRNKEANKSQEEILFSIMQLLSTQPEIMEDQSFKQCKAIWQLNHHLPNQNNQNITNKLLNLSQENFNSCFTSISQNNTLIPPIPLSKIQINKSMHPKQFPS